MKRIVLILVGVLFFLSNSYSSKNAFVTIQGIIYNETGEATFSNFPVTIYPNYKDTTNKFTVYTNPNGLYYYTFELVENKSIIKLNVNCENNWTTIVDTVNVREGPIFRDFYICHNPLWYMQEMIVEGTITYKDIGEPAKNHTVIITSKRQTNFSRKLLTNENGFYSDTFTINILYNDKFTVSTYSACYEDLELLSNSFYSSATKFVFDFEICKGNNNWKADFYHNANPDSNLIYFCELSNYNTDSVHWYFGDGCFEKGKDIVHYYEEHGSYKVTMKSFLNGNSKKITKRIIIGNTAKISGNVFTTCGESIDSGYVVAYKKSKLAYSIMSFSEISNGEFCFDKNIIKGDYIFYAIPFFDVDTLYFPKYLATYNDGCLFWENSQTIEIGSNNDSLDIYLSKYSEMYYGKNNISVSVSSDLIYQYDVVNVLLFNKDMEIINSMPLIDAQSKDFKYLPQGHYAIKLEIPGIYTKFVHFYIDNFFQPDISFYLNNKDQIVYNITSLDKTETENVNIYPNPFSDYLFIHTDRKIYDVFLYSADGKCVFTKYKFNQSKIFLDNLTRGLYILILKDANEIISEELIIKN